MSARLFLSSLVLSSCTPLPPVDPSIVSPLAPHLSTDIIFDNHIIDRFSFPVDHFIVISECEFFFLVNGSLFHKLLSVNRSAENSGVSLVSRSVACFTVDSELSGQLFWISSSTGDLCSPLGCEEGPMIESCKELQVLEATFLFTTSTGKVVAINRVGPKIVSTPSVFEKKVQETLDSTSKVAAVLALSFLILILLLINGRTPNSRRGSLVSYQRGSIVSDSTRETGSSLSSRLLSPHAAGLPEASDESPRGVGGRYIV